jgi:hypothetical protein
MEGLGDRARLYGLSANYGDPVDTAHGVNLIRGAHEQG